MWRWKMMRRLSLLKIGLLILILSFFALSTVYAITPSQKANASGRKFLVEGKFNEADAEFNKAKGLDPKDANAYWGLGVCASEKGQADKALPLLNKAIELDPSQGGFHENRAVVYAAKKDFTKALADVEAAQKLGRQLNPDFVKNLKQAAIGASGLPLDRGMKFLQSQKFDEAITEFDKVKALDPSNATAYWGLGVCASAKGQTDKALDLLNKAIALDPKQGGFYQNRAGVYSAKKNYAKALADAQTAQKLGRQLDPTYIKGLETASKGAPTPPVLKETKKT